MATSDTEHDSALGEQVGGRDLAGENCRMMRGRADNPGEESDALRTLRRRHIKAERKGRAGKLILAVTFRSGEKIVSQFVGERDLLENFSISLLLGFSRIRKFGKQSNLHFPINNSNALNSLNALNPRLCADHHSRPDAVGNECRGKLLRD